jgi:hypothetical protein
LENKPIADLSKSVIVPVAKGVYLCDDVIAYENRKADLYGLFNAIRPESYPCTHGRFCVFAQLVNGLGRVPFYIDVRDASEDELVYTTLTNHLLFPDRVSVVQLSMAIEQCTFPKSGVYLVQIFCDNKWVCDTTLLLR